MTDGPIFYPASPTEIRDGTFARLQKMNADFKKVYRQRTLPTKDDQLPIAAVWTARDTTQPNGDANVGSPSFFHTFTLAIDIVAVASTEGGLDQKIVALAEAVRATLLTDASWVDLFEGIERCNLHYTYPKETDFLTAVATIEIEVSFRSEWPPVETNEFSRLVVDTTAPGEISSPFEGYATTIELKDPCS